MRRLLIIILLLSASGLCRAQEGVLALSFDGIPMASEGSLNKVEEVAYFGKFLDVLEKKRLSTIGFAIGAESERYDIALLSRFVANGHKVGLYSFDRMDLNSTTASVFLEDLNKANEKLERYLYKPRYYRFPELHYGNSLEKQDSVLDGIESLNLVLAPASCYIDVRPMSDVYMHYRNGPQAFLCDSIGMQFVDVIMKGCRDSYWRAMEKYDREVRHILSIPYTPLTVDYLSVLIDSLKEAKWIFTSIDSALADPIYKMRYYNLSEGPTTALDGFVHEDERVSPPILIEDGEPLKRTFKVDREFKLNDFYSYNPMLEQDVDKLFETLSDEQRFGQLIVQAMGSYGHSYEEISDLVSEGKLGGVLLLKGNMERFRREVASLDRLSAKKGHVPLLYSADAEPSLLNMKISGSTPVPKTDRLRDAQSCRMVTEQISEDLNYLGVNQNYAPVCDVSNSNKAMYGNRSFGSDPEEVAELCKVFIETSQANNVIATAKHFPGHGKVRGDSHQKLVYIDGELSEVGIYKPLIEAGVLSIMVGHIAVRNNSTYNTYGYPASCSRKLITGLLKEEMKFKGLVVSDAMNMGALNGIQNAPLEAVKAGCDMVVMPKDADQLLLDMLELASNDESFKRQAYTSVKKVLRMKYCLGLL